MGAEYPSRHDYATITPINNALHGEWSAEASPSSKGVKMQRKRGKFVPLRQLVESKE
jgi:hypothetical protein